MINHAIKTYLKSPLLWRVVTGRKGRLLLPLLFLLVPPAQAQEEGLRDVEFHVVMKNKNNGRKELEAVQYSLFKSLKKAHDARIALQNAISQQEDDLTTEPGFYIRQAAQKGGFPLNVSANNGAFTVRAKDGMAVLILAQSQFVEVREILPNAQAYNVEIETRVLDEVVKIDRRRRGPDFSNVRGYDTGTELRFSCPVYLPEGIATEDSRLFIQPIAIDCETEDTVAYGNPAIFEGLKYHTLQVRRKGFNYYRNDPVGKYYNSSILLDEDQDFEYTHEAVVKKPDKNRVYRGCYRVMVEDYTHIIYDSGPVGDSKCFNIHPFKFMDFAPLAAELPISEEFETQTQCSFPTPGDAVAQYLLNKDAYLSGEKKLSDGDLFTLFSTLMNEQELDDLTDFAYKQIIREEGYELNNFSAFVANRKAVMQIKRRKPDQSILRPFIDYNVKRVDMKRQNNWFSSVTINREEHLINQAIMMFQSLQLDTAAYILSWLPQDERTLRVSNFVDSITRNWDAIYAELYKTLPEDMEEEKYDSAGFTRLNKATNFNSLDYKLDRRYKPSVDKRTSYLWENSWIEGGFGIEQHGISAPEFKHTPIAALNIGVGTHFASNHALRLRLNGGYMYQRETDRLMYRIGGAIEHLYDFTSAFFGYKSDRAFFLSSILGLGGAYYSKPFADNGGGRVEGHAGLQAKFRTSPHADIAIEPYAGIASNVAGQTWRRFNFFYGANLSYIYYIENQLTGYRRRQKIQERDLLDELAPDSTLYSWRKPFFIEVAGSANKAHDWRLSIGQHLSTALALRLNIGLAQPNSASKREQSSLLELPSGSRVGEANSELCTLHSALLTGGVSLMFNPFGLKRNYLWDNRFGGYIVAGMAAGSKYLACNIGVHAYARIADAVQVFAEPRFEHDTYNSANLFSVQVGVTVTSRSRERTEWTKAEERDYSDRQGRFIIGVGGGFTPLSAVTSPTLQAFLEYRLNAYHYLRADGVKFLKSGHPQRAAVSLAYMLNVSNLIAHVNPYGRRFETLLITGPALVFPASSPPLFSWQLAAKQLFNITSRLSLHLTPAYYFRDKDLTLNLGVQYAI